MEYGSSKMMFLAIGIGIVVTIIIFVVTRPPRVENTESSSEVVEVPKTAPSESDDCAEGDCLAAEKKSCDDIEVPEDTDCINYSCESGVVKNNSLTGESCDDGDECTSDDKCDDEGNCAGDEIDIDDGDECTTDSCDKDEGVVHEEISGCGVGCGNGAVDGDEECDGTNLNGKTCEDFDLTSGILRCSSSCKFDYSNCEINEVICGDNNVGGDEKCDGTELNSTSCESLGYDDGDLVCFANCSFDTSDCEYWCGNSIVDDSEECDGDELGGETCVSQGYDNGTLSCLSDCNFDFTGCVGGD